MITLVTNMNIIKISPANASCFMFIITAIKHEIKKKGDIMENPIRN